jgi:hypothetical protein
MSQPTIISSIQAHFEAVYGFYHLLGELFYFGGAFLTVRRLLATIFIAEGEQFSDYVNPDKLQKRHTLQEGHSPDKLKPTVD